MGKVRETCRVPRSLVPPLRASNKLLGLEKGGGSIRDKHRSATSSQVLEQPTNRQRHNRRRDVQSTGGSVMHVAATPTPYASECTWVEVGAGRCRRVQGRMHFPGAVVQIMPKVIGSVRLHLLVVVILDGYQSALPRDEQARLHSSRSTPSRRGPRRPRTHEPWSSRYG